jgi:mono/diheme cytochrome c family protein
MIALRPIRLNLTGVVFPLVLASQVFLGELCDVGRWAGPPVPEAARRVELLARMRSCPKLPPEGAAWGEQLIVTNGCTTCHSLDGSPSVAPTFRGLVGRTEELTSGARVTVDAHYIYESIRKPDAAIARGYKAGQMPTFTLSDRQIEAITGYLATLDAGP